jgi:Cdc6-like AAA superfamily ATPase
LQGSRLTLLFGPAGVGKTSVLNAGVAYHLGQLSRQNVSKQKEPDFIVTVFDGWADDPLSGLLVKVHNSISDLLNNQQEDSVDIGSPLANILKRWTQRLNTTFVIILDHFEEFFLYHGYQKARDSFTTELSTAINDFDLRANFLISIHEDALARMDIFKGTISSLFDNYLRMEHLYSSAARAAIIKPIEQYNLLHSSN